MIASHNVPPLDRFFACSLACAANSPSGGNSGCYAIAGRRKIVQQENLSLVDSAYPWFITGFADAESCFYVGICQSTKVKTGWEIQPEFKLELHEKDLSILETICQYFKGKGQIIVKKDKSIYRVRSIKDLELIINHFDDYPLVSNKYADYILFKTVLNIMTVKDHLTEQGLLKILSLKASLNLGLPVKLKEYFPNIIPTSRTENLIKEIKNPNWLAGFVSGEGCFLILTTKNTKSITLRFKLTQHTRDNDLMKYLEQYLGCGAYYPTENIGEFVVSKFLDIKEKIIPFFEQYPLLGNKYLDYLDFKKAALLVNRKEHLTKEGYERILLLKAGMNRGR